MFSTISSIRNMSQHKAQFTDDCLVDKVGEEGVGVTVGEAVAVGVLDVVKLESESDHSS